jgi:NAD-dependent dihydropyrimidine dehydrogenase PreA subunit
MGFTLWLGSASQTDKWKQGVCQSHCRLAIYIKKYLNAKEEISKLMLSPTSINEKITYVYILKVKKQHTQPDKPSAPPSQAHCQSFSGGSFTCTPLGLNTWPFYGPTTQKGLYQWMAMTLHPTPSYILPETCQNCKHNLKLCKNNATLFWRSITCQKRQHNLKLGKH